MKLNKLTYKITVLFITFLMFQSCKPMTIKGKAKVIVESFKSGKKEVLTKYGIEGLAEIPNIDVIFKEYAILLKDVKIEKQENFIVKKQLGSFENDKVVLDSIIITTVIIPLGIEMPSVIPSHFFSLNFIKYKGKDKLVGLEIKKVETNKSENDLKIVSQLNINKRRIVDVDFIYEGGHKNPMIFKRKSSLVRELGKNKEQFKLLLKLINESEIIKSAKKNNSKKFNGDAELEIIKFKMDNNHEWILFSIISEEKNKKEVTLADFELRYYKFANIAVSYWIKSKDKELILKLTHNLTHSGENIRTKLKESVKLEVK